MLDREVCAEHNVPNFACSYDVEFIIHKKDTRRTGHSESELEILVVVCQMVLLHISHVLRKLGMMQPGSPSVKDHPCPFWSSGDSRVMHAIIHDVERKGSRDDTIRNGSWEDEMAQPSKRGLQDEEQQRRHD